MLQLVLVALGTVLADAITKLLAARCLQGEVLRFGALLELRLTQNDGMALGLFAGNRLASLLLPPVVIVCGFLMLRRYRQTPFTLTAAGLVLGGFVGNFAERIAQGYVLDMLYFPWLPWFVCNVADIAICFGVALMVVSLLFRPQDWREKRADDGNDRAA